MRDNLLKLIMVACCLLPFTEANGQSKRFESKELRQAASLLSGEIGYADKLYNFMEVYLNQLLSVNAQEREWRMKIDDVRLEDGALDRLHLVGSETKLAMRDKDNRYTISLSNGNFKLIELSCPMSYQLLTQQKLKELEKEFMKELSAYKAGKKATAEVDKKTLKKTGPDLYFQRGADYYLEAINNDLYYIENKGKLSLVYDSGYVVESVSNMLMSEEAPCNMTLKLCVRQYGFKTDELFLPLKQWIGYCKSKGCEIYVGVEKMEADRLRATVFVVNEIFKYNHVMNVEIPYALLGKMDGEVDGNINVFIPTHNLLSLFEDLNLINKKKQNR